MGAAGREPLPDQREDAHHPTDEEIAIEVWEDEAPTASITETSRREPFRPLLRELRVGIAAHGWRTERDTLGEIQVPADRYWGAQTQRSLDHFAIGDRRMPVEVVHAYGVIKQATAWANGHSGRLADWKAAAITHAAAEVRAGALDDHFPLSVYQTGSGTHTHANVNEVIANRANQLLGFEVGTRTPIDPSDDVNLGQSTNDTFITAMHVALAETLISRTLPDLDELITEIDTKAHQWAAVMKLGRTHLMDATPLTVGQEWSGLATSLLAARSALALTMNALHVVPLGGTAVGTGLNTTPGYSEDAVAELARLMGRPFTLAGNTFAAQATIDDVVRVHAALKSIAVSLFKVANDLRWLASGPRAGLHELVLPENEAGSTMMPGKVNPTQAEATLMACVRVIGNDVTVTMAGAEGNFQLNAFRPVAIDTAVESAHLIGDVAKGLARFLIKDAHLDMSRLDRNVARSAMSATALVPMVGHDQAAAIARYAIDHDIDLQHAAAHFGVDAAIVQEADRALLNRPRWNLRPR